MWFWKRDPKEVQVSAPTLPTVPTLPADVETQILLNVPISDLGRYCLRDKLAESICQSNYFWSLRLSKDFPGAKVEDGDARESYIKIYRSYLANLRLLRRLVLDDAPPELVKTVFDKWWNPMNPAGVVKSAVRDPALSRYRVSWQQLVYRYALEKNITGAEAAAELAH